jgi:hypothetical protein
MMDTVFEIGDKMFMIERLFGWVIGYNTKDSITLTYGNEREWYLETWHGVDGYKIMKVLNNLGWQAL